MGIYNSLLSFHTKKFELPVGVYVAEPQDVTPYHSHEYCEVAVVKAGHGRHCVYGCDPRDAVAGDVFILPKGAIHCYSDVKALSVVNVIFAPDRIPVPELDISHSEAFPYLAGHGLEQDAHSGQVFSLHLNEAELAGILDIICKMNDIKKAPRPGGCYLLYCLLLDFIGRLCLCEHLNSIKINKPYKYIDNAVKIINKAHDKTILLDDLARKSGMSARNLRRQFKRATGVAPSRYIMEQRIRKGAELLITTELPVGEIAIRCGFCDGSYFSVQFCKQLGMTPSAYRKHKDSMQLPG